MPDERINARLGMFSAHEVWRQPDPQAQCANQFAQSMVVGQMIRQPPQAAERSQSIPPQAHGLAGDVALVAEKPRQQYRRYIPFVDVHGPETRPYSLGWRAAVNAGDQADVLTQQRRRDAGEIVGSNEGVAVGHRQDVVARVRQHVDQVADLQIAAVKLWVDHEFDRYRRKFRHQPPHHRAGGIIRIAYAKDDLKFRIILPAE